MDKHYKKLSYAEFPYLVLLDTLTVEDDRM